MANQIYQSAYTARPTEALAGALAVGPINIDATIRAARGRIKAGYGVFKVPGVGARSYATPLNPGQCFHIPDPAPAADVDAIITAITSSTSVQTFSGTQLNGAVGATEMQPARFVTLVLSNHTDWDATNATLTGVNHLGQTVSETIAIPNGGNATVTSTTRFRSVTSLSIPAQTGAGGTATVGISPLTSVTAADFLGVAIRAPIKESVTSGGIFGYPGITSQTVECNYVDGEPVSILRKGDIWVVTEEALSEGDDVYVRITSGAGGSTLGAFRNDADTASAVLVTGAKVRRDAASGLAWVHFPYV